MTGVIGAHGARIRPWLLPVAAVLCALLVLWAAGGLRTVVATSGRPAAAEQEIQLARWVLVIHRLELVDRSPEGTETPTAVRLHLRATFTGQASIFGVGTDLLTVETPAGPAGIDTSPSTSGARSGGFDPDVAQEIALDYRWPTAGAAAPATLRVLVRDEEEKESFLFNPEWSVNPTVAVHLDLPCPDRRTKP
ncbi:MAG: hypothetical protein ABWX96_19070 [Propionibacteriaceae bacterium]